MELEGKNKISQAHLDSLHVLLQPLIKASHEHKDITWQEAAKILHEWDSAREL